MIHHFVLTLNPQSVHEWEQCVLRNPITGEHPDLRGMIAEAVKEEAGAYLISVKLEVNILEKADVSPHSLPLTAIKPALSPQKRRELAAS